MGHSTVLRHRLFRLLVIGQFASNLGDAFYVVALPWYVLSRSNDVLLLGTLLAGYGTARIAFLGIAGHASDRWGPWTVMMVADIIRVLALLGLALASASIPPNAFVLMPLAILLGTGEGLFLPGSLAIVPSLLPDSDLQEGNAFASAATQLPSLIGPALGGAAVAIISASPAFAIDAASFGMSAYTLARIRYLRNASLRADAALAPSGKARGPGGSFAHASAALPTRTGQPVTLRALIRSERVLQIVLVLTIAANLGLGGETEVALPALAHGALRAGATGYGGLLTAFGAGALVGTVIAGRMRAARRPALAASLVYLAAALFLAAVPYLGNLVLAGAALAGFGVLVSFSNVLLLTAFQRWALPDVRGRIMSLLLLASAGIFPVSVAIGGLLVRSLGPRPFFPIAAAGIIIATSLGLAQRSWRDFGISTLRYLPPAL